MLLFDFTQKKFSHKNIVLKNWVGKSDFFLMCHVENIQEVQEAFCFDESTVLNCTDLDESVRFNSFEDYDFISLIRMEKDVDQILLQEINLYVSAGYIIMVMPDNPTEQMLAFEDRIVKSVSDITLQNTLMNRALYTILHLILTDFSDLMEAIEDELESFQAEILENVNSVQYERINSFRKMTYTIKKQLRASSYLGVQILVNINGFISKKNLRYFSSIDTRLKKLCDFSESLYELSNQLLNTFDSRMTAKTNETVNKLTAFTIFFGPLTVITGIYGMNFTYMPELQWRYAYPATLLFMVLISATVYWLLKRKKWL